MSLPDRRWKLEDAKAHFSEVVRNANSAGPQRVTVRGRDMAVVLSAADYERLVPQKPRLGLVDFMEGLDLTAVDLDREADRGRDIAL